MKPLRYTETKDAFVHQKILLEERKTPIIFDVGAYIGSIALKYAELFPDATIYAFEPFAQSFEKLEKNIKGKEHMILTYPIALGENDTTGWLNVNAYTPTNSLLPSDAKASSYWGENLLDTKNREKVDITTLDTFCRKKDIENIDILKLDTQGTEYAVLAGAQELLSEKRIALIYMEIILVETYVGQKTLPEITDFLASFDYRLFNFYNPIISDRGELNQIDAIFLPVKGND